MRRVAAIAAPLLAAQAFIAPAAVQSSTHVTNYRSVREIYSTTRAAGIPCSRFRQVRPTGSLQRDEGRCRTFAATTFRSEKLRRKWIGNRLAEAWFPARFLVTGRTWTVWTWSRATAGALQRALGGTRRRVTLPPAQPRSIRPCGNCASPRPARPTPRGLDGPVYSFGAKLLPASATLAEGGLYVVLITARGTSAVTGILLDRRGERASKYVAGMPVVLEQTDGARLRFTSVSDGQGGFAFIDIPVRPDGSCYTLRTPTAGGFGAMSYAAFLRPEPFVATEELLSHPQADGDALCVAGNDVRPSARLR
jgi:hypothetical protein